MKSLLMGLAAAAALSGTSLAGEPSTAITWFSITTDSGAVIGHASREIVQHPDGREIVQSQEDSIEDEGDRSPDAPWFTATNTIAMTWRTVRREDAAGRTVSISSTTQIGPEWRKDWSRDDARIADGVAEITRQTPVETRTMTVPLPPGVRFDEGDGLLPGWTASKPLDFDNFDVDAMAVEHVVIAPIAGPPDAQGRIAALRTRYDGDRLMAVARLLIDREGRIVDVSQPMFRVTLLTRMTDKETALHPQSAYRTLPDLMTKSPYRISASALSGHIRYSFAFRDGISFTIPQTGEQSVTARPGAVTVDICSDCGPGLPADSAALADARKATAWMQSDSKELQDIAAPVARLDVSDTRKMELLAKIARSYLGRIDFTGHYSALETLSRRAGDCTEAATLLAALGRAAGIPTRVADGLVYSREAYHGVGNTFLPHSWTLAWADGRWRSFDAALDTFDSTHIALTVGDGDARSLSAASQLAGLLRWESLAEIRSQPEN